MTMLFSDDGFDYDGYDFDEKSGEFVCKDEPEIALDLELEFDDFCSNFRDLFRDAPGFVCVGSVKRWDGSYDGGKVLTDIGGAEDFVRTFTDGYGDCTIRLDDDNGKLTVTLTDHDGGMMMYVRELTSRGLDYYYNHYDEMSDRDLHRKLMDTPGLSKDVNAAFRVWGTPKTKAKSKNRKNVKTRSTTRKTKFPAKKTQVRKGGRR